MSDEEEIILSELSDEELVLQMHDDLYDGLNDEIVEGVNILLERKWQPYDVLTKALVEGMRIVGEDFRDGILFVPEVLLAANAANKTSGTNNIPSRKSSPTIRMPSTNAFVKTS